MADHKVNGLDHPQPGRPTLGAVREPLIRTLSDSLYAGGQALIALSRDVERRVVTDYRAQGEQVGGHMLGLVLLCGQLASLDEMEGGRMHGHGKPHFPESDGSVEAQIATFKARRGLEQTQRRVIMDEEHEQWGREE